MPNLLKPEEYNASYFDGAKQSLQHNAGYSTYERWYRNRGKDSRGEFWKDEAIKLISDFNLVGKKFLEIGCAKGFLVKDLRDGGVDAYGLDVSQYAIDNCEPEVAPYLIVGDARKDLKRYLNNEFDLVFSRSFLPCISESELPDLIKEMNRISKQQYHQIDQFGESNARVVNFYLNKSLQEWLLLDFKKGTKLVSLVRLNNILIK